jgi:hypothetical protein
MNVVMNGLAAGNFILWRGENNRLIATAYAARVRAAAVHMVGTARASGSASAPSAIPRWSRPAG